MACILSDLKLPEPDVRLVVYNNTVVKVKLRCRNAQVSAETNQESLKFWTRSNIQSDIKRAMTYVLSGSNKIEPIRTDELVIYPYKRDWPNASKFEFVRKGETLGCSKDLYMFFIERIEVKNNKRKQTNIETCEEKRTPVNSSGLRVSSRSAGKRSSQIRSSLSSMSSRRSVTGPLRKRKRRSKSQEEEDKDIRDRDSMATTETEEDEESINSSGDDFSCSESDEDEERTHAKDPGVIMSILGYLFTPMKSIRRIWR